MRAVDPNPVIAILCSDIHLSERAPIARAVRQDWFTVQKRYLDQLQTLKENHNAILIVAGDVFDYWKSSPELINFALAHMPGCYAVPGQHDLPNHNYNDLHKSAYWTLVEAGSIKHLDPYIKMDIPDSRLRIIGMPWGFPCQKANRTEREGVDCIYIAVVHAYCYSNKTGCHPHAKPEQHWKAHRSKLKNFDVAVFGDHHKGFLIPSKTKGMPTIYNSGTLLKRTVDEMEYCPRVGLLRKDGTVEQHYLDCSQDEWIDTRKASEATGIDFSKVMQEIERIGGEAVSFIEHLERYLSGSNLDAVVERVLRKIIEKVRNDKIK